MQCQTLKIYTVQLDGWNELQEAIISKCPHKTHILETIEFSTYDETYQAIIFKSIADLCWVFMHKEIFRLNETHFQLHFRHPGKH